jgi:replicative DNA helicase
MVEKDKARTSSRTGGVKSNNNTNLTMVRSMPESLAAEAAVLGSMIINPECINNIIEKVKTDTFYRVEHRIIFDALISLYEKSMSETIAIDAVLLRDELEKRNQIEEAGGVEYIRQILDSVPSSANVMYYADIIRDKQLLREMITAAHEILDMGYNQDGQATEKLDMAETKIFEIAGRRIRGSMISVKDLMVEVYELIEKRRGRHVTGLSTGFYELDDLTSGLQNGEMIIIAGRPSMGKTALALNIAEFIGMTERMPVAIFSLEMGRQQLAERFLCSISRIDSQHIRKGLMDDEHYKKLADACAELSEAPIYIDDTSLLTPLELRAKARRLKSQHDIRMMILDYMQLMSGGSGRYESRQQEITVISRYLKALARELNIPVVVLSQLNRSPEGREDHRPRMSDLRESGSIEQDADVVMLLHREDYYTHSERLELSDKDDNAVYLEKDEKKENSAELIIAKQRNGPTGKVDMIFRKKFMRFENASQYTHEPADGVPF